MTTETFTPRIAHCRIVPVIVIDDPASALPLADALLEGGLTVIEVTLRTRSAMEVIRKLAQERPQLMVGAGTVLTMADLEAAHAAGAAFAVAPGLHPPIVKRAQELKLPFIPGVATATEIEAGMALGCELLKFFPAEALGGARMLAALSAPYKHTGVRFMPTGGINMENLESYLKLSTVFAIGGAWIATQENIAAGQWAAITDRCRSALAVVKSIAT